MPAGGGWGARGAAALATLAALDALSGPAGGEGGGSGAPAEVGFDRAGGQSPRPLGGEVAAPHSSWLRYSPGEAKERRAADAEAAAKLARL